MTLLSVCVIDRRNVFRSVTSATNEHAGRVERRWRRRKRVRRNVAQCVVVVVVGDQRTATQRQRTQRYRWPGVGVVVVVVASRFTFVRRPFGCVLIGLFFFFVDGETNDARRSNIRDRQQRRRTTFASVFQVKEKHHCRSIY